MSVIAAAKTLGDLSGWNLTPLDYQKILYVAQMIHLARESRPLFSDGFEAWDYGPVVPTLYRQLKRYQRNKVPDDAIVCDPVFEPSALLALGEAWALARHLKPGQLVNFTHREGGAWATYYQTSGKKISIPPSAMLAEWRELNRPSVEAVEWAMAMADDIEAAPQRYLDDARQRAFRASLLGTDSSLRTLM